MFNRVKFGKKIAQMRRAAGLTQEQLVERIGEDNISISTLKRIENGQGHIDMLRVIRICKALDIELSDLLGENVVKQALERFFNEPDDEGEVQAHLDKQRFFYPEPSSSVCYTLSPIKTLMELIIYLPLMDEMEVLEVLRRIEGAAFGFESYVMDKLRYLYKDIPDSKAKRYADYEASKCTYEYFVEYYSGQLTEADSIWFDPEKSKEMLEWHDEYVALIEMKMQKAAAIEILKSQ